MINIALTQGMKNNDLIQELKGNATGESSDGSGRQELIYLYKRPSWYGQGVVIENPVFEHLTNSKENVPCTNSANHIKNWDYNWLAKKCIAHEVIAVDRVNEYAIIEFNLYKTSICDVCNLRTFHYHAKILERLMIISQAIFCVE